MVESWIIWGLGGVLLFVGSGIGGVVGGALVSVFVHNQTFKLQLEVQALRNRIASPLGNAAKEVKSQRQTEAIATAMAALKSGKNPQEVIKEVAMAYPDVALSLGKKLGKNLDLGGLEGLV